MPLFTHGVHNVALSNKTKLEINMTKHKRKRGKHAAANDDLPDWVLNAKNYSWALSRHNKHMSYRSEDIKGVDGFGTRMNVSLVGRFYKAAELIDLEFKKCPFTSENSICVEPRLDDNGDFMGLKSMALDLNCVEMPSGGTGYKKDNPEHNKMLGLKLNLGEFGCKITRTDANGKKLTTHAHHESHVYYIRHTAFVPGNWEIVKNIMKKS